MLHDATLTRIIDGNGILRHMSVAVRDASRTRQIPDELVVATLRDLEEIWGWPEREMYYISAFETKEGPRTVIVEVWGDVKTVHMVSAEEAEEFRTGMLLFKR